VVKWGILQNKIKGIKIDNDWCEEPINVKEEALKFQIYSQFQIYRYIQQHVKNITYEFVFVGKFNIAYRLLWTYWSIQHHIRIIIHVYKSINK